MMLRVVLRTTVPLAVAAVFCLPAAAQATGAASSSSTVNQAAPYGTPVEQIVARVNDQVITNSDLTRAQQQLDHEAHQQNESAADLAGQQKNLLRDLIDKQLLLSKGKEMNITGDTQLIKSLDEIRKQNHLDSMEDLEKAVQQQGTSYEDFKANIRNNIITQNVVREEVGRKLQPSQAQMEAYYREHKDSFTQQESVHLSEILIPTDATATEAQLAAADVQAKDIEAKLKSGGDFAQLAKQYSGGPTAQQGGDLGEFHRGALAKVLEDQTFSLPVGSYTQPIRTKQGYVILKVTQHVPGGTPTLQQVEPQVEEAVYMEQIPSAVRKYLTLLREQAYIDIRPGFVDSGASPNETKPIYSAYAAPQSKKKKKQDKSRLETNVRYTRYHKKSLGAAPIAATAVGSTTGTSSASSSVSLTPVSALSKKKIKKEKIRFGRAPLNRVSEEQVATSDESAVNAPPEAEAADANLSADVQPLGPDLTHTPGQQVKKGKTRLSDQAKLTHIRGKNSSKHSRNRKSKVAPNRANAPTPDEQAAQKVQSAPLGLEGDTSKKAKHKKTTGKPGEKTRLGDQRQNKSTDTQSNQAPATPVSSSSSSAGSSTPQQQ